MKLTFTYDSEVDALSISWGEVPVEDSDEIEPGVILDYDASGGVLGVEILGASKKVQFLTPTSPDTSNALRNGLLGSTEGNPAIRSHSSAA